jgi:hypothetical protein
MANNFNALALASPARFERTAPRLGIWCSIRLSYGDTLPTLYHNPAENEAPNQFRATRPSIG